VVDAVEDEARPEEGVDSVLAAVEVAGVVAEDSAEVVVEAEGETQISQVREEDSEAEDHRVCMILAVLWRSGGN
jgi:hypothetical protein